MNRVDTLPDHDRRSRLVRCSRNAMGTRFEIVIVNEDQGQAESLGELLLDGIESLSNRWSRFQPASELSRINREGANRRIKIDPELTRLLAFCEDARAATDRCFDISTIGSRRTSALPMWNLDRDHGTVVFTETGMALDLGAIAKGYAAEWAVSILRQYQVQHALINAGNSTIVGLGNAFGEGQGWPIALRTGTLLENNAVYLLRNQSLSCSAVFDPDRTVSDIVDPRSGERLTKSASCIVIGPSAIVAEVLSTAFLVMGKHLAAKTGATIIESLRTREDKSLPLITNGCWQIRWLDEQNRLTEWEINA